MNPPRPLVLLALASGCATPAPAQPNWLIIAPDSFCADRIGAHGDGTVAAPHMSELAAEGVTFTNAFSQSGWTTAALASILTGHYPAILAGGHQPLLRVAHRRVLGRFRSQQDPRVLGGLRRC